MVARGQSKQNQKATTVTIERLHGWNKWLAWVYVAQGAAILGLSAIRPFAVTTTYLGVDSIQSQAQGQTVLAAGSQHLFDVNLTYVVAAFLFMAALAHGLLATKLRPMYERDLRQGINKIRWIEYALSGGTMMLAIGLVVGVRDISALIMLFGLTAAADLLWLVMELQSQSTKRLSWLSYILGCGAGALPWIVVVIYLIGSGVYGSAASPSTYGIFATMLVLFVAGAGNTYVRYRKVGNWTNYLYTERLYILLSFVAKTAVAWQIFAGTLRP